MSAILIVDDKEENRYLLQSLLAGQGYEVISAIHGADALEKARQKPPDLIIADILMPVMDGFSLCRQWKSDNLLKSIPFVFYTATYTDERDRTFALSLGADRFIIKPVETDELLRMVEETMKHGGNPPSEQTGTNKGETIYLKQYNEVLIRKLEAKMEQLEQMNKKLEKDVIEHRNRENKTIKFNEELEKLVAERTSELKKTITQLEELNRVFIGRELKMAELKKRIEEMEKNKG